MMKHQGSNLWTTTSKFLVYNTIKDYNRLTMAMVFFFCLKKFIFAMKPTSLQLVGGIANSLIFY